MSYTLLLLSYAPLLLLSCAPLLLLSYTPLLLLELWSPGTALMPEPAVKSEFYLANRNLIRFRKLFFFEETGAYDVFIFFLSGIYRTSSH